MLHFIPPPQEKKKKKPQGEREAYEVEADVSQLYRYCIHVQNVAGYFCLEIFFWPFSPGHFLFRVNDCGDLHCVSKYFRLYIMMCVLITCSNVVIMLTMT